MFTSPHECGLCTHHISSSTDPGLVGCSRKGPHFLQKNPPAEISGYGPDIYKGLPFTSTRLQSLLFSELGHFVTEVASLFFLWAL